MIESEHGLKFRLQQLLSNLREGVLHLRRLIAHKITAGEVFTDTISEQNSASGVTADGVKLKDSEPYCDVINEKTAAAGVTVDGVKLKDSQPYCDVINEKTATAGVTIDGVLLKDSEVTTDVINEKTGAAGVTADGVLLKDGVVAIGDVAFDDATSDPLAVGDAAADGTENSVARKDHVHPTGGTAGGELGGSYPNPTVDATHSGSAHHTQAHGIADHTGHANWKALYTDGSGDEQEIALGADGTVLTGTSATGAPAFEAADEHAHTNDHAQAHTVASHSDTTATGTETETLTDGSDADALHDHATLITSAEAITAVEGEATLDLAGDVTIAAAKSLAVDTIAEKTADAGVTVGGVLLDDDTIVLDEIAISAAPSSNDAKVFAAALTGNDSLTPGATLTGLYARRPDGLMVKLNDDFPYSTKMRHVWDTLYGDVDEVKTQNSWLNYSFDHAMASFIKDFLGCVWVQGMIKSGSLNVAAFYLPEGYWNTAKYVRWPAISNDAFGILDLRGGHTVWPCSGSNVFFSLSNMAFPDVNRITWHAVGGGGEPAFENSWVNFGDVWDVAAFAKDALGRVWVKGMVKSGDNGVAVFTLPAGYRPTADIAVASMSNNNVLAKVTVHSDGSVKHTLTGAGTNAWASITMNFMADGAASWTAVTHENSWVDEALGDWDTAAYFKDAAGIVHIKGRIENGTIGLDAFTLPVGYRPKQNLQFGTISNNAIGRIQVAGDGEVQPVVGNNNWFSVHCSFVAEQ